MKDIKWAVLGTGVIANEMAQALIKKGKSIYSVANRTHQKAVEFAKKYNIDKVYEDMNDVFEDPEVDVIYITTPHNTHYEFMIKAINSGAVGSVWHDTDLGYDSQGGGDAEGRRCSDRSKSCV